MERSFDRALVACELLDGERITVRRAALEHDVFYLSRVISQLRHRDHMPIKKDMIVYVSPVTGRAIRCAEYYLTSSDIALIKGSWGFNE